jgi:hypothetical protein
MCCVLWLCSECVQELVPTGCWLLAACHGMSVVLCISVFACQPARVRALAHVCFRYTPRTHASPSLSTSISKLEAGERSERRKCQ